MNAVKVLDTDAVKAWAAACVGSLQELRADIDGINVYPVADGDTGSNLLHTLTAARHALEKEQVTNAGAALRTLAIGAVGAAKGNSGVIMSQVLRGMAEAVGDADVLDGPMLAAALVKADAVATGAVARPVAGTMLSVLHAVGLAVGEPRHAGDVATVTETAAKAAAAALAETPNQLAALAVAGVVDAGGRGIVAVLDALGAVVSGTEAEPRALEAVAPARPDATAWEVMYLLSGAEETGLDVLRRDLSALGDSVTVAGDGAGNHAVHVHCADIGKALEAGLRHGIPRDVRVEPLLTPGPRRTAATGVGRDERAVVAVVHGDGLAELIAGEGVPVLAVPDRDVPTAEDLINLVAGTAARHVTVLPGGVGLTAAAEQASGHAVLEDCDVVVVPCASGVQVLAALAVHDDTKRVDADVVAMAEAAAATRRGEVTVASEEAITWIGRAHQGDVVGLIDGEVVLIESSGGVALAAMAMLDRMLAVGGELVTLLTGLGAPEGIEDQIGERLRAEHPEVELVCYAGRQTDAQLLIGVE